MNNSEKNVLNLAISKSFLMITNTRIWKGLSVSAGMADLVRDLAREVRVRGASRRVGMDVVTEREA